ncbi:MAG: DUF790 family protein, partial [Methylococcales bacterium]|nr:DUF790 family protein [Methylococcales bacterium]
DLINILRQHIGKSRGSLAAAWREYEGDSLDYPIIRGLTNVLEAGCEFNNEPPVSPPELRAWLFERGIVTSKTNLLQPQTRHQRLAEAAATYAVGVADIEASLFADLAEEQLLLGVADTLSPAQLIARYNLEVARGLLYWAREMKITVFDTYKEVFKYIKLFKLMHVIKEITGENGERGYEIDLQGPLSPFVASTMRYGLQFAKFMPALLLCQNWHMVAKVRPPNSNKIMTYQLDHTTSLKTHFKPAKAFDSKLEANFAAEFSEKYTRAERKWTLGREDELLLVSDSVMIPDFSFTHVKDGRRALLEIVGFWHPDYLRRKLKKVRAVGRTDLILLVYESTNVSAEPFAEVSAGEVI